MSRYFDKTENAELRAKIDEARPRLPMPELMRELGFPEKHIGKTALCPFHSDEHPSFSVFQSRDGKGWQWKCHAGCGNGDEIAFLVKHFGISRREAITRYLDMAGFPSCGPRKSHEYPKSPQCPESLSVSVSKSPKCLVSLVYPMSNGQGSEEALKASAVRNACSKHKTAKKGLWQLARDLRAVEKQIDRKLSNAELMQVYDEWYRLSQPFLDPAMTRDDYLAAFLAKPAKVRIPTGDGDTLNKALATVAKLSPDELPAIPGIPNAPERLRRIAALHRELWRLCGGKTYFLTCRDTAKAVPGLSHQAAWNVNLALAQLGVVQVVRAGDPRPGGKASQFRYLLSESGNGQAGIAA
jgi:hypothetical protein